MLGMDECGNVIDQLEERFNAFIAHERRSYRTRLDGEMRALVQRATAADGKGHIPVVGKDKEPHYDDCMRQGRQAIAAQEQEPAILRNPAETEQENDEPSEPSSGIYSPSRESVLEAAGFTPEEEEDMSAEECVPNPNQVKWTRRRPEEGEEDSAMNKATKNARLMKTGSNPPNTQTGLDASVVDGRGEKSHEKQSEEESETPELSFEGDSLEPGADPAPGKGYPPPKEGQCKSPATVEKYRIMRTEAQHLAFLSDYGRDMDSI